ncbi:MAG: flagellar basal-body MS-ring/collar protein FliF [Pseudomonadota bacterium]
MSALLKTFNALDLRKKIILGVAVAATLALMLFVARGASQPNMALLYGGLDAKAAGEVVAAVEQLGVATEIRGDAIFVPMSERDRVRLALAKDGLPAPGQAGYELLENLSGFGTTSEMFEAAYWRSKEGELARTIAAVPGVRQARVHIGAAARRPFSRSAQKSRASVTVTTVSGPLSKSSATSIRFLVSLAVADLEATQVAVIDARHGVVLRPGEEGVASFADENAERRAARLREELEGLLAVRVGDGNVRISVAVETTTEAKTVTEKIIDPESRVTVMSETEELSEDLAGARSVVTVASNLPDGDQAQGGDDRSRRNEAKETITYSYSETQRSRVMGAGAVKRIGVAVLVNEVVETAEDGTVSTRPRSPQELAAIEDLVKSAVAFDAERGDTVTVESMAFAAEPQLGTEAEIGLIEQTLAAHIIDIIQVLVLAAVALALGFFVVRPILASAAQQQQLEDEAALEALENADAEAAAAAQLVADGRAPSLEAARTMVTDPSALPAPAEALGAAALAPLGGEEEEMTEEEAEDAAVASIAEQLRAAVGDRSEESVALLKRWLHMPADQIDGERA